MPELDAEHRDQLAEALAEHHWLSSDEEKVGSEWVYGLNCECGEFVPIDNANSHVADALAPLVAGWLADAWDEGWHEVDHVNPYRSGAA